MTASPALCPECGAPSRSSPCPACGHTPLPAPPPRPRPASLRVDAAWRGAARATLAFLALQITLRAVVIAQGGGSPRTQLLTAALGTGVILGVHRGLTRRNEAVLLVWSWVSAASAALLGLGAGLWWAIGSPGLARLSVALAAAVLTGLYALWLRRAWAAVAA